MPIRERYIPTILAQWQLASCQNPSAERHYEREMRQMRRTATSPGERRRVEEHRRLWRQVRMRAARTPLAGGGAIADMAKMAHDALQNLLTALNKSLEELSGLHDIRQQAIKKGLTDTQISQAYNMVRGYARADQDGGTTFFNVINKACEASKNVAEPKENEIVYVELSGDNKCCPHDVSGAMSMNILASIGIVKNKRIVPVFAQVLNAHPDIKAKYFQDQCPENKHCDENVEDEPKMITHDHFMILMRELEKSPQQYSEEELKKKFSSASSAAGATDVSGTDDSAGADVGDDAAGASADDDDDDDNDDDADSDADSDADADAGSDKDDPAELGNKMTSLLQDEDHFKNMDHKKYDAKTCEAPVILYTIKYTGWTHKTKTLGTFNFFATPVTLNKFVTSQQKQLQKMYMYTSEDYRLDTLAKQSEIRQSEGGQKREFRQKYQAVKPIIQKLIALVTKDKSIEDKAQYESEIENSKRNLVALIGIDLQNIEEVLGTEPEEENAKEAIGKIVTNKQQIIQEMNNYDSLLLSAQGLRRCVPIMNFRPDDYRGATALLQDIPERSVALKFNGATEAQLRQACENGQMYSQLISGGGLFLGGCPVGTHCYDGLFCAFDPSDDTMFKNTKLDTRKPDNDMRMLAWEYKDGVHQEKAQTGKVFLSDMIKSALDSKKNVYMFGMGISGSGKTYFLKRYLKLIQEKYKGTIKPAYELYGASVPELSVPAGKPYAFDPRTSNSISEKGWLKEHFHAIFETQPNPGIETETLADRLAGSVDYGSTFVQQIDRASIGEGELIEKYWNTIDENRVKGEEGKTPKTISFTVNNPESSRSILVFPIQLPSGKTITIVDLPGAEDTWSIVSKMISKIVSTVTIDLSSGNYPDYQRTEVLLHILALSAKKTEHKSELTTELNSQAFPQARGTSYTIKFIDDGFAKSDIDKKAHVKLEMVQKIILEGGFIDTFVGQTMKKLWKDKLELPESKRIKSITDTDGMHSCPDPGEIMTLMCDDTKQSLNEDLWLMLLMIRGKYGINSSDNAWRDSLTELLTRFEPGRATNMVTCDNMTKVTPIMDALIDDGKLTIKSIIKDERNSEKSLAEALDQSESLVQTVLDSVLKAEPTFNYHRYTRSEYPEIKKQFIEYIQDNTDIQFIQNIQDNTDMSESDLPYFPCVNMQGQGPTAKLVENDSMSFEYIQMFMEFIRHGGKFEITKYKRNNEGKKKQFDAEKKKKANKQK